MINQNYLFYSNFTLNEACNEESNSNFENVSITKYKEKKDELYNMLQIKVTSI